MLLLVNDRQWDGVMQPITKQGYFYYSKVYYWAAR